MRKIIFLSTCYFLLSTLLIGCTIDRRYTAEKLFWQAEQKKVKILKSASSKLEESDYQEIISAYRKVSDTCPLESLAAKAQFIISNIYLVQNKPTQALDELKKIIQNFSSQAQIASQAQFATGIIYESQGKWEEAFEEYEKVIDLYPLTPLGLRLPIYIVQHYKRLDDQIEEDKAYTKALRHYNTLLKDYDQTSVAPVVEDHLAIVHLQKGKLDEAIKVWDAIVSDYPTSPQAANSFLTRAALFSKKMNTTKAIEAYEEFIDRYPEQKKTPEVKLNLGLLYFKDGKPDKAKDIFLRLLRDYPDNDKIGINAYLGLSHCYRKEKDTSKIIEVYESIKNNYPSSYAALAVPFLVAQYYQEAKLDSKADVAYEEAIAQYKQLLQNPENKKINTRQVANFLAISYLKKNEIDEAIQLLKSLADKYPQDPTYLIDLATLYRKLNNQNKAVEVYEELVKRYPDNKLVLRFATSQIKVLKEKISK